MKAILHVVFMLVGSAVTLHEGRDRMSQQWKLKRAFKNFGQRAKDNFGQKTPLEVPGEVVEEKEEEVAPLEITPTLTPEDSSEAPEKKKGIFAALNNLLEKRAKPTEILPWPEGPCRAPTPGEKLLYFVQAGAYDSENEDDGRLAQDSAEDIAKHLKKNPMLKKAIYGNASERAELVITSPKRAAMETAILGFGKLMKNVTWEVSPDIRPGSAERYYEKEDGTAMLLELGFSDKLEKDYSGKYAKGHGKHGGSHDHRWHKFMDEIRLSDKSRFIVVAHSWHTDQTGMNLEPGEVGVVNLKASPPDFDWFGKGAFRILDKPECWDLPQTPVDAESIPVGAF